MKFPSRWLRENVAWNCKSGTNDGVLVIYDNVVGSTRWSVLHEAVFQFEGVYYRTSYGEAATECQSEAPYEYDEDMVEVEVVEPYYTVTINYLSMDDVMKCGVKPTPVDDGPVPVLARLYVTEK